MGQGAKKQFKNVYLMFLLKAKQKYQSN